MNMRVRTLCWVLMAILFTLLLAAEPIGVAWVANNGPSWFNETREVYDRHMDAYVIVRTCLNPWIIFSCLVTWVLTLGVAVVTWINGVALIQEDCQVTKEGEKK